MVTRLWDESRHEEEIFTFSRTSRRVLEPTLPPIQYAREFYPEGKAAEM